MSKPWTHNTRKRSLEERFWEKVTKGPNCWEWQARRNHKGYGQIIVKGKVLQAHRVAWELTHGPIPEHMGGPWLVLHKCDNPSCVRPDHLWLGTDSINLRDSVLKGRYKHGMSKRVLSISDIRDIQALYWENCQTTIAGLARQYEVDDTKIWRIVHFVGWPAP